jgi:DNA gyrase subunit A
MQFVKGPDFPTGALILGRSGILDAYRTGRGSVRMRAVAEIVEERNTTQIVVTEIPYQTAVESIDQQVADALERGDLSGITATQDLSAGARRGTSSLCVAMPTPTWS